MSKARKTVDVNSFKQHVNNMLKTATVSQEVKQGMCLVLEELLHKTGNYNGYNFIAWYSGGFEQWVKDGKPKDNSPYLGPRYDRFYY